MPKLSIEPTVKPLIKLILLGYSGTGKSTSYVCLGIPNIIPDFAPFELRVLDFDAKAEEVIRAVLANFLHLKRISRVQHDAALANFDVCVCRENTGILQVSTGKGMEERIGVVGRATAWTTAVKQLKAWNTTGWSDRQILIVDSFTYAVDAIANYSQQLGNKLNQPLKWTDFLPAQQFIQNFLTQLADVPCHSIIIGHQMPLDIFKKLDEIDPETQQPKQELMDTLVVPTTLGKAGAFKIPALSNHMLVASEAESGERRIWVKSKAGVLTKTPFFARAKDFYKIETGLAEYFSLR